MLESTYAKAFSVLRYRDKLPLEGPPVLNSYSTPFSFSRFPASPHQSSNRPPSVQFDPLDPPFSAIMTAYSRKEPQAEPLFNFAEIKLEHFAASSPQTYTKWHATGRICCIGGAS